MNPAFKKLYKEQLDDFLRSYKKYFIKGVSKSKNIGMPRFLEGKMKAGALLIHGYMASPAEMSDIAAYLNKLGFHVYLVSLPGHGTAPANLSEVHRDEWRETVEKGYHVLKTVTDKIIIAGFSTGAALTLEQASRFPDRYKCAIVINTPLFMKYTVLKFIKTIAFFKKIIRLLGFNKAGSDLIVNNPENPDINYFRNSINGLVQLTALMKETKKIVSKVTIPLCIIQGQNDYVVSVKSSQLIFKTAPSPLKRLYYINSDRHVIVKGKNAGEINTIIKGFLHETGFQSVK